MIAVTERVVGWAVSRARAVLAAVALITVVLTFSALRIGTDFDITSLSPDDPANAAGGGRNAGREPELILVAVEAPDLAVPWLIAELQTAIAAVAQLPQVAAALTPFNHIAFSTQGGRLVIERATDSSEPFATTAEAESFIRGLVADRTARNLVVSGDGSAMRAIFVLARSDDFGAVNAGIARAFAPLRNDVDVYVSGRLRVQEAVRWRIGRDIPILAAVGLLVIGGVHLLSFRTARIVALPLGAALVSTLWTLGVMALLGMSLTIVGVVTPVLILTLGNAYVIHVVNQFYRGSSGVEATGRAAISSAIAPIVPTVALAAVTTAVGFGSQLAGSVPQMRQFGLATAIGVLICAALAVTAVPAALALFHARSVPLAKRLEAGLVARAVRFVGGFVLRRRAVVLLVAALLLVGFVIAVPRVTFQTDYLSYFRGSEAAVEDTRRMIDRFGGYSTVNMTLTAPQGEPGYFLRPAILSRVADLEDRLAANVNISHITSFVSYLRQLSVAVTGADAVPESRPLIMLLARYFNSLGATDGIGSVLGEMADQAYSRVTIILRVFDGETRGLLLEDTYRDLVASIERAGRELLPEIRQQELWGATLSQVAINQRLSNDQLLTAFLSTLMILIMASVGLRSLAYGLLALVPLVVAIAFSFVVVAALGIQLDLVTVSFVSIALGLGVDSSIHLLLTHRRIISRIMEDGTGTRSSAIYDQVLRLTLASAGRAIVLATLPLICGLLTLTLSSLLPIAYFGLLVAVSVAGTTLGTLFVLPALLAFGSRSQPSHGRKQPRESVG